MRCWGIHLIGISQKTLKLFIAEMSLKFPNLRLQSNPPGANELMALCETTHDNPSEGASDVEYVSMSWYHHGHTVPSSQIARFMGPTWGPSRAHRTQVGPMLASWTLLSGLLGHCPFCQQRQQTTHSSLAKAKYEMFFMSFMTPTVS